MSDKETAPALRPYMDRLLKKLADPSEAFHYINAAWQESPEVFIQAVKDVAQAVAVECRAPAPQPTKEEAEIAVDKMFNTWLSRHCFFYANKTLRASGWREIAISLYRRAATPQVTPTELENAYMLCAGERDMWKAQYEKLAASPQVTHELELEQEAEGRWLAEFTRFPGVAAYGPSKEEAIRNAAKVLIESGTPKCRRCAEGNIPEWSKDAKCYIHRSPTLDRRCDNPPNPPCIQVPEETVSSPEHQAWLAERKKQDPLNPQPIFDVASEQASPTPEQWSAFAAGMRAGEIAQREKIIKAVCTGCRAGWPEQGRPGDRFVIHVHPESGGLYACQAAAIRALPAAPEEKK